MKSVQALPHREPLRRGQTMIEPATYSRGRVITYQILMLLYTLFKFSKENIIAFDAHDANE